MADWLTRVLSRIRELVELGRVRFTFKALEELEALDPELAEEDVYTLLTYLERSDFDARIASTRTGEWMYVFKPRFENMTLYVKVVLRADCVLISFHEDEARW